MTKNISETVNELPDYQHIITLENNVKLKLKHDSLTHTQKAIYSHESFQRNEKKRPVLTVKQKIVADYDKGIMTNKLNITFEIINHENRGQEYFLGVDISKDSQIFLDITYTKKGDDSYSISEIYKGATCIYSEEDKGEALMLPAQSPLNILTTIAVQYGNLKIPTAMAMLDIIYVPVSITS